MSFVTLIGWVAIGLMGCIISVWVGSFVGNQITKGEEIEGIPKFLLTIAVFVIAFLIVFASYLPFDIVYTGQ